MPTLRCGVSSTILAVACGLAACNSGGDTTAVSSPGNVEQKPVPTTPAQALAPGQESAPTVSATIDYVMTVYTASGLPLCHGTTTITVLTDFSLQIPEAVANCINLKVDLGSLFNANFKIAGFKDFTTDGKVLSLSHVAAATFTPPRPFLLGPLVQDAIAFQGFSRHVATSLTATDPLTGKAYNAAGAFDLQVLGINQAYSNSAGPNNNFQHVMDWTITTTGFAGVPVKEGLLFKSIEWLWNTEPVMIPKIIIKGALVDFISADGSSSGGTSLVGDVTIELVVASYKLAG